MSEEQADLEAQESNAILADYPDIPEEFKVHYTQIIMNNLGMRTEVEKDFRWVRQKLILMREATHTIRMELVNEMLDYFDKAIPEMEKIRKAFEEQIDIARKSNDESKTTG